MMARSQRAGHFLWACPFAAVVLAGEDRAEPGIFWSDTMHVNDLHTATAARLAVVGLDATLRTAALCLSRPGIGLVVVCGDVAAAGVLTKSDLVRHLSRAGAAVAQLMTRPIVSCDPNDDLYSVWQTMTARKLQNMPVLGVDRKPLGILDIRDAMQVLFEHEQYQERLLIDYIDGVGYR
jgi:CBS domain-containing protein